MNYPTNYVAFFIRSKHLCLLLLLNGWLAAHAQKIITLYSPDGALQFSFQPEHGTARYSVQFQHTMVVAPSLLSLDFENGLFQNNLETGLPVFNDTTENYTLAVGKASAVQTHYRSVIIPLQEKKTPYRTIYLHVKLFNDGLAFRYEIPAQTGWVNYVLLDENTRFHLSGNPTVRSLLLPNYTSSHEGLYTTQLLSEVKDSVLMDMPALFQFSDTLYLAITEAALLDYAGMYLSKQGNELISKLSPLPGQTKVKVKATLPHHSPWRVLLISNRIGTLVESNIITTLNEPCHIKDLSWLHPGKTTFPWWNGNVVPDTLNAPGNNFVTQQYYIDFCARNSIAYHSVVEYGLHQWYTDDGEGFQPGPHNDVTKPVPGLDMKQVCDYAASKGVGIRVWVHWAALYSRLDTAFAIFEKWGIKGMMVDFMDRDDQEMVNIQTEMLEKAAQHHLHIQFHGAYKPTEPALAAPGPMNLPGKAH